LDFDYLSRKLAVFWLLLARTLSVDFLPFILIVLLSFVARDARFNFYDDMIQKMSTTVKVSSNFGYKLDSCKKI